MATQEYQRVQYVMVDREDEFFSTIAKKYKGRYYKNLKQGPGWSFPFEYKSTIDCEREIFTNKKSQDPEPEPEPEPESEPALEQESEQEPELQTCEIGTDPIIFIKTKNRGTMTMDQKHSYTYDIPNSFKNYYEFYTKLIQL
jgi:hypothetical protein